MSLDITPAVPAGRQIIHGYGEGRIRVSETVYEVPIMVTPDETLLWPVAAVESLSAAAILDTLPADDLPDILLLGCGVKMLLPSREVRDGIQAAGIVLEPMDTGAACRTYNVLLAEERRVAAALFPVP